MNSTKLSSYDSERNFSQIKAHQHQASFFIIDGIFRDLHRKHLHMILGAIFFK